MEKRYFAGDRCYESEQPYDILSEANSVRIFPKVGRRIWNFRSRSLFLWESNIIGLRNNLLYSLDFSISL